MKTRAFVAFAALLLLATEGDAFTGSIDGRKRELKEKVREHFFFVFF